MTVEALSADLGDIENPAHHRDSEERDEPDRRRHAEVHAAEGERHESPGERERHIEENEHGVQRGAERREQQRKDDGDRDR